MDLGTWGALGLQTYGISEEDRKKNIAGLSANTKEGRQRRKAIFEGIKNQHNELHALGTAMGQHYTSSAVVDSDEPEPFSRKVDNPAQHYVPSTYPGSRLPHAWLGKKVPGPLSSTLDLAGKGHFTLFTGIGGDAWKDAALAVQKDLGVNVKVVSIGYGLEWEDIYLDWTDKCGVEEDGCVLVRPDYFVAWRAQESGSEAERLGRVMRKVLGREEKIGGEEGANGQVRVEATNGVGQ